MHQSITIHSGRRTLTLRLLAVAVAAVILLVGCGNRSAGGSPSETEFDINPELLDTAYENASLGIAVRPPRDWTPLEEAQRNELAQALALEQQGQDFFLEIVDVFLHTDTFSFSSVSRVTDDTGPSTARDEYVEHYWENLQAGGDDELRGRTTLLVNGLTVEQIRHALGERITFTLITTASDDTIVQVDYSIPAAAYPEEGLKLESSIGTLSRIVGE